MKSRSKSLWIIALCAILCAGIFIMASQPAHAVRVSLKRVVFDGSKRSEILTIINNTAKPQTYRLGWRKYRMDTGKSLRAVKEGEDASDILWAEKMVRYAPRRVTVPPGGSQQIRLLFRRPADLQEAEYRAHLWIVSETQPDSFTVDEATGQNQAVKLNVQPAISLPIFVRNGNLTAKSSITDAKLTRASGGLKAAFRLSREGNRSIYGDFEFLCTDQGKEIVLHQLRGIAVYTETPYRDLDFDIPLKTQTAAQCNTVKIVYRADPKDTDFAGATLAQATVSLQ